MFGNFVMTIKTAEESRKQSEENRLGTPMEKIMFAIGKGNFETVCELDYIQTELLGNLGYTLERQTKTSYKITW